MWSISGIVIAGGIIAWIEAPYLVRKKRFKELGFFIVLLLVGVTACILQALRVPLPNPLDWITIVHKPISDFLFSMLK